jgi:hypothetical protein
METSMTDISRSLALHQDLKERLKAEYQLFDEDQALVDTLEGMSDLRETISAALREALTAEAMAKGIKDRVTELKERGERLKARADRIRALALHAMQEAVIPSIHEEDFTVTVVRGGQELIVDEVDAKDIPPRYQRIKYEIDRTQVRKDLEEGIGLKWAWLGNSKPHLTIRTR